MIPPTNTVRMQPDMANTFKLARSTPAPRNGANGALVSWLIVRNTGKV